MSCKKTYCNSIVLKACLGDHHDRRCCSDNTDKEMMIVYFLSFSKQSCTCTGAAADRQAKL